MVTAKDIDYLLRGLFGDDWHDYKHERTRVQTGSALALFSGSGARAGAVVESNTYRKSNEYLIIGLVLILSIPYFNYVLSTFICLASSNRLTRFKDHVVVLQIQYTR